MCFEYDVDYALRRAEEARKAMQQAEERMQQAKEPKPAAPVPGVKEREPVPA